VNRTIKLRLLARHTVPVSTAVILKYIGDDFKMNVNRKMAKKTYVDVDRDDGYVEAEKHDLISMIWEITKDTWSFVKEQDVKRRLQRDVAAIVRRAS